MTDAAATEAQAELVLTVSSFLHGERLWRHVGKREHSTRDGRTVSIAVWRSACVICGGPFEVATPIGVKAVGQSRSFETTTCSEHRLSPSEAARLRFAKREKRRALFEAMRRQKLSRGAKIHAPPRTDRG